MELLFFLEVSDDGGRQTYDAGNQAKHVQADWGGMMRFRRHQQDAEQNQRNSQHNFSSAVLPKTVCI